MSNENQGRVVDLYTVGSAQVDGSRVPEYHMAILNTHGSAPDIVTAAAKAAGLKPNVQLGHYSNGLTGDWVSIHPPIPEEEAKQFGGALARQVGASTVRAVDISGTVKGKPRVLVELNRQRPRGNLLPVLRLLVGHTPND